MAARITKTTLQKTAARLVERYVNDRARKLDASPWEVTLERLLGELLCECPGFSTREYRAALNTRALARLRSKLRVRSAPGTGLPGN